MDVLLDSNIYLENLKMTGNQFAELFAYLRRTGSNLVLPHLVREEVSGKYSEWLRDSVRQARTAHANLWKLTESPSQRFSPPNIEGEVKSVLARMRRPSKGVKVLDVDDYSSIDLKEVVNRGVQRKRPSTADGEELRDVVLWLLVLSLAKNSSAGMVFISKDGQFASEDGQGLHPDLAGDLMALGAHVDFYRSLREFVVAKALDHESIDANSFYSVVRLKEVEKLTMQVMLRYVTRIGSIKTAELKELEFERATRYKVGADAYFVEASFGGAANVLVEESIQYLSDFVVSDQPSERIVTQFTGHPFPAPQVPDPDYAPQLAGQWVAPRMTYTVRLGEAGAITYSPPKPREYLCSFIVNFSARVAGDHLESLEIDSINFKSFLPAG